jgi:Flp pilus assembly protein TadD
MIALSTNLFFRGLLAFAFCCTAESAEKKKPSQKANPIAVKAVPTVSAVSKSESPAVTAQKADAQKLHDEALAAFQRGDFVTAKFGYQKVLELAPDNAPALLNLALVEQRLKQFDSSDRHLKQIISKDSENAAAWLVLGINAYQQEKLDAAFAHLAQAVLYAPKNPQAHQFLGVTLGRKGWYSAGEDELRRAIELDPKFADAHYNLAVLYMQRVPASIELARRHYQTALELGAQPDAVLAKKFE